MPPQINKLLVKSTNPRVYVITMRPQSKKTIRAEYQTEFQNYATTDPNIVAAGADGQQGKVWIHAKDPGKAAISFDARSVTIPVGIPPKGKKGKPGTLGVYANNKWTTVTIEVTVAASGGAPPPTPPPNGGTTSPSTTPKPKKKKPGPKRSPAAAKVLRAENFLANDRPDLALKALLEAEELEGAEAEKSMIADLRKRAKKIPKR